MKHYIENPETGRKMYFDGEGARTREELCEKFGYFLTIDHRVGTDGTAPEMTQTIIYTMEDVFAEADGLDTAEVWLVLMAATCIAFDVALSGFSAMFLLKYWNWTLMCTLMLASIWGVQTNLTWIDWALGRSGERAEAFNKSEIRASKSPIAHPDDIPVETPNIPPSLDSMLRLLAISGFNGMVSSILRSQSGVPPGGTVPTEVPVIRDIARSDGVVPPRVCPSAVSHECDGNTMESCEHAVPHAENTECLMTSLVCPACVPHLERRETGPVYEDAVGGIGNGQPVPDAPSLTINYRPWLRCRHGVMRPDGFFSTQCGVTSEECVHAAPHQRVVSCQAHFDDCSCPGCDSMFPQGGTVSPQKPPSPPTPSAPALPAGRKIIIKDRRPEDAP